MRTPARCSNHIPARGTHRPDAGDADPAVGNGRRQLLGWHPGRAFDRNALDPGRMDADTAMHILLTIPPTSEDDCIIGDRFHCAGSIGQ